jgi:hypothetical protein
MICLLIFMIICFFKISILSKMVVIGSYNIVPGIGEEICPSFTDHPSPEPIFVAATSTTYAYNICEYPDTLGYSMNIDDINRWKSRFVYTTASNSVAGLETLNTILLPEYCSGSTNHCPPNPIRNQPLDECSQFLNTQSTVCSIWATQYPELADEIKTTWCEERTVRNSDNTYTWPPECDCINKELNPVWQVVHASPTGLSASEDHCWYLPCANPSFYLPLSTDVYTECPDVCGIVVKSINDSTIVIPPDDPYINCNLNSGNNATSNNNAVGIMGVSSASITSGFNNMINSSNSEQVWNYVLLGLVILVLIGLVVAFSFFMTLKRN